MSRPLLGCSTSGEKQVTSRAMMKLCAGDLERAAVLIVVCTAGLAGSKPTPAAMPKTGPSPPIVKKSSAGDRVLKFDASDCRYVSVSSVCPGLERKAVMCSWRNVTPSPIPYHQTDDPKYFGHILPVSFVADTQGWHYTMNASTCGDLLLRERIGSNNGVLRVGCVCWHPAVSVDHLLCAFDMPAKGFHHPQAVEITGNTSVCHASTINALSANTNKVNPSLTSSQNQSSNGIHPTTNVSSDHSGKKDQFRKFGIVAKTLVVIFIIIAAAFAIGIMMRRACCRGQCSKDAQRQLDPAPEPSQEGRPTATLSKNKAFIIEHVELGNIPETLMEKKVLTKSDFEEVVTRNQERGRGRAMETLIDILCRPEHANDIACFVDLLHVPRQEKEALFGCLIKSVKGRDSSWGTSRVSHLESLSYTCTTDV